MPWKRYEKYRDSGVEWLGDIPEGWKCLAVNRLLKYGYDGMKIGPFGSSLRMEFIEDIGKKVYGQENVINNDFFAGNRYINDLKFKELEVYQLLPDDVIVTMMGTTGRASVVPENNAIGIMDSHLVRIRVNSGLISPQFLALLLDRADYLKYQILRSGKGSIMQGLNSSIIRSLLIILPPLPEQHAISAFLDRETPRIDALIEKKERLIALLEEKRAALISHAVTKGLDPDAKMKDSGVEWIGMVPERWKIMRLKYISPRISGRLVYSPAQYFTDEGVPFLFGTNITKQGISFENLKYIPPEINAQFSKYALRKEDLVMVRVGEPGLTTVIPQEADGLNCASLMIIRKSNNFNSQWLSYVLNSDLGRYQVKITTYGAALEQINITDAVNFVIPTPSKLEQIEISDYLTKISMNIQSIASRIMHSISLLKEYRSVLISAAVTGKIDVRQEAMG